MPDGLNFHQMWTTSGLKPRGAFIANEGIGRRGNPRIFGWPFGTLPASTTNFPNADTSQPLDGVYNQAASVVLIPANEVPPNMRLFVKSLYVQVHGGTSWAGGNYAMVADTSAAPAPVAFFPTSVLQGNAEFSFPGSGLILPITVTAASYASATGVVTFPATSFQTASYVNNAVYTILSGTGAGQSGVIASNTATTLTPAGGAAAFPVSPDSTSVFAIWSWVATAGAGTTATFASQDGSATPLTANQLANGFQAADYAGTGVGQSRGVISNTSSVATVNAWQTNPAAGDLFQFSTNPALGGAINLSVAKHYNAMGLGQGLQLIVSGTMTQGSNLRVTGEAQLIQASF